MIFKSQKFRSLSPKFRRAILLIYILYINYCLFSQYIGITCSDDYHYAQAFQMNYDGTITLGDIFSTGGFPSRINISKEGLVIIANNGYSYPDYLTLTVLKIDNAGSVQKVRDVDLGGMAFDICITKDNKYALGYHRYELGNDEYDYGMSILRLEKDDVKMPPIQFLSLKDLGLSAVHWAINQYGVVLGITIDPLEVFDFNEEGCLTYTYNNIPFNDVSCQDIIFDNTGYRAYVTTWHGLAIIDIDVEKNVSLRGYINTISHSPYYIVTTPDSRLIFESMNSGEVIIFRKNDDNNVVYKDKIDFPTGTGAMAITPDGKLIVVGYNYTISSTDLSVIKINPDETVERLVDKDITVGRGTNCIGLYKLPETSVNEIWEMYK